jgi:hypothetical protein
MWGQPKKSVIDRPALIAILGGVLVLMFIAVVTFGVQHWPLWKHVYVLDSYVPREARVYLHIDISSSQLRRWDSDVARARWSPLVTAIEEKLKLTSLDDLSALSENIGSELAFAQRTVAGQAENILLIKTKSASKFEAQLNKLVPSHLLPQAKNVWISNETSEIFSLASIVIPQLEVSPQHVYWMEVGEGVYILSSTPKFIDDAQVNNGKYRSSIGDAMAGYRTGAPFISGFMPLANIWTDWQNQNELKDMTALSAGLGSDPVYYELNAESEYAWGQIRNYSQRLFDRLAVSDAESVALATRLNLPEQYRATYLRLPLGQIFSQLIGADDKTSSLQSWIDFAKQSLGADWAKEIAPIVDVPADLILGQVDEANPTQPFLLALLPTTTDELDNQLNNLEALFRRLAGQLYPRENPMTLIDGSKVTELLPDPQTNAWHNWTGDGAMDKFQVMDLPTGGQIYLGRIDGQNVISNSTELLKVVTQPKSVMDSVNADCLRRIRGNELVIIPGTGLSGQSSLVNRFSSMYLANGSDGNRMSLMFCLILPHSGQ